MKIVQIMMTHVCVLCGLVNKTKNGAKKAWRYNTKIVRKRVQFNIWTKNGAKKALRYNTKIVRKRVQFNIPT